MRKSWFVVCCILAAAAGSGNLAGAQETVRWDFSKGTLGWKGNGKVASLKATPEGMAVECSGHDPWITAPAVDFPGEGMVRLAFRMKSSGDGAGEFFFGPKIDPAESVKFHVLADGEWHDYSLVVPRPLGRGRTLRLDPSNDKGEITIAWLRAEPIAPLPPFAPQKPKNRVLSGEWSKTRKIQGEHLALIHPADGKWGGFAIEVDAVQMAAAHDRERVAYRLDGETHWLDLDEATAGAIQTDSRKPLLTVRASVLDSHGAKWRLERRFEILESPESIGMTYTVSCDRDREIVYLPALVLFPGLGTFEERKTQALFAGVEYLADEPSSSEAEIRGSKAIRRVPDPLKITMPLMAVAHRGRFLGVTWEKSDPLTAAFDSPDRIYGSGAHVMALIAPGFEDRRFENEMMAYKPMKLEKGVPLVLKANIIGGRGETVVPAVRHYLKLKPGLPETPRFDGGFEAAACLLAKGWLDSESHHDGLWRHAVWGDSFKPAVAPDAAAYLLWLKDHVADAGLSERVEGAIERGLAKVPEGRPYTHGISHVRYPVPPLLFGRIEAYLDHRASGARRIIGTFGDDGIWHYKRARGKPDYAETHFADHANGLAAVQAALVLETASLTGDETILRDGLAILDKMTGLYAGTVPRGAQSWEMPLHTPDILASAYLIKAYVLGFELTGKEKYLDEARYWAWTGVPFLYLAPPTDGDVGSYATIAVLGATNWRAPFWIGQPVQWCGLVYAAMLRRLEPHDPSGPWKQLAGGITAAGLQMTWPESDGGRVGLLPDFFHLRIQHRDGPAIVPGTVQASLPELFGKGKLYDFKRLDKTGWLVHAPCEILGVTEADGKVRIKLDGVGSNPYHVLIARMEKWGQESTRSRTDSLRAIQSPFFITFNPEGSKTSKGILEKWFSPEKHVMTVKISERGELVISRP